MLFSPTFPGERGSSPASFQAATRNSDRQSRHGVAVYRAWPFSSPADFRLGGCEGKLINGFDCFKLSIRLLLGAVGFLAKPEQD